MGETSLEQLAIDPVTSLRPQWKYFAEDVRFIYTEGPKNEKAQNVGWRRYHEIDQSQSGQWLPGEPRPAVGYHSNGDPSYTYKRFVPVDAEFE